MGEYAYTKVSGKIGDLLDKLRETGIPQRATNEWLRQIGFGSSNDRSLAGVLEQIGFVDAQRVPTARWKEYRGSKHEQVLADALREGYAELFSVYPDAHNRTESELRSFFSTRTNAGAQVMSAMVNTFKALAARADFGEPVSKSEPKANEGQPGGADTKQSGAVHVKSSGTHESGEREVNITINIQLTLPESKDDEVYDKFFAALKKHLMSE